MSLVYILTALVCVSLLRIQDAGGCKKNSETSTQLNDVDILHEGHVTVLYWTNSGNRSWTVTVDSKNFKLYKVFAIYRHSPRSIA